MALDPQIQALMGGSSPAQPATPQAAPATEPADEGGGLDPQLQQLSADAAALPPPSSTTRRAAPTVMGSPQMAFGETALQMGTGTLASAAGGLASLVDAPLYASGLSKTRPDKLAASIASAGTYQPRTIGGQALSSAMSYPFRKLAQGADAIGSETTKGLMDPSMKGINSLALTAGLPGPLSPLANLVPGLSDAVTSPRFAGTAGGLASSAVNLAPMALGAKAPYLRPNDLNIGLDVGGKTALSQADVLAALKGRGIKVKNAVTQQSGTEPTVVARTSRPLSPDQANGIAADLGQESIAQAGPEGNALFGPKAPQWGPFNPGYFLKEDGTAEGPALPTQDPLLTKAAGLGLRFAPSEVNPGFNAGNIIESLSNSAKLLRSNAKANAPQVAAAVNGQVGVPEGTQASVEALNAAKKKPNAVYAEAAGTGTVGLPTEITEQGSVSALDPGLVRVIQEARGQLRLPQSDLTSMDAGELIDTSRQLRASGFANLRAQRYNPALKALGDTQIAASKALEDSLDAHAQQLAQDPQSGVAADLVPRLKAARTTLAQIASARRALRPGGNYSAASFFKQGEQGVPLSGDMSTIGQLYGRFDRSLQDVNKIRNPGPFGALDLPVGAALAEMARPLVAVGTLGAPPLMRSFLGSRFYQSRAIARPPSTYVPPRISPVLQALKRGNRASRFVADEAQQPQ